MRKAIPPVRRRSEESTMGRRIPAAVAAGVLACAFPKAGLAQEAPAGERELLTNGSLEEGARGWTFGHGWYESPKGSGVSAGEVVPGGGRNGSRQECFFKLHGLQHPL